MKKIQIGIGVILILIISAIFIFNSSQDEEASTYVQRPGLQVKKVTASGDDGNIASNTLDNNILSRWSSQGEQWIKFELTESELISYLGISFYKGDQRATKFDIEVSEDDVTWTNVYSGQSNGTTVNIEAFDIEDIQAKYIKLLMHGNTKNAWNSISEVQIYEVNEENKIEIEPLEEPEPEVPQEVTYNEPGFINSDGTEHKAHQIKKGKRINIKDFGVDLEDNDNDDTNAFIEVLNEASKGDEIYLPDGVYNLVPTKNISYNIFLKSGVNLVGQSKEGVIIKSEKNDKGEYASAVIKMLGQHDIKISNLTITSAFDGKYSDSHEVNNIEADGPRYGIQIEDDALAQPSYNVTIDNIIVEKYQTMGVRIATSHDVVVRNSLFKNATDVGGGGAGYGVSIQGEGNERDRLGYLNDSRYNLVEDCIFEGPYIRHGVLIQYYSHNNVVRNNTFENTRLDAIDLHGEDEYLNEVYGNTVSNVETGAGVGVGNTGASHDKAGPGNYIHDNTMINCREGVKVYLGSEKTVIENNIIKDSNVPSGKGIYLLNAPETVVKGNKITNNNGADFIGINLAHDTGTAGHSIGDPDFTIIEDNTVTNNTNGIIIEAGGSLKINNNVVENNKNADFEDLRADDEVKIYSAEALTQRLKTTKPGDTITIGNGIIYDQEFIIDVDGTKEKPITIKAETPGEVILTGTSRLRIGGDYIIVDGLYFKDGSLDSTLGGVIEFRAPVGDTENTVTANYSILRNTIVAYYNNEDRKIDYKWISLYGTYNTVEYCEIIGKNHSGAALVVWRDDDSPQYHNINHNKFMYIEDDEDGNGAEAIRIGTSDHSLSDSFTTVEYNYFEQCNGEIEVISNKSGNNTYRGNTFVDTAGLLTLRHGDNCTVEGNFFFGNGYYGTGGIRVIGENHTVINNYIEGTVGDGGHFRSAICLTNGVENSPLNRYFQVKNAYVANNILVNNNRNIIIGGGADSELTLPPLDCTFENNIVLSGDNSLTLVQNYDEPINITYKNNVMFGAPLDIEATSEEIELTEPTFEMKEALYHPVASLGVSIVGKPLKSSEAGPKWLADKDLSADQTFRVRNLYEEAYAKEVTVPWGKIDGVMVLGIDSSEAYVNSIRYKVDIKDQSSTPIVKDGVAMIPKSFIEKQFGVPAKTSDNAFITLDEIKENYGKSTLYDERGFILITDTEENLKLLSIKSSSSKIADLYKVIASSDDGNLPANTLDGILSTRWSADGDGEWLRYNLFKEETIASVGIAFYKGDKRSTSFEIQVSDDAINWTSIFEGTSSGESAKIEMFNLKETTAKYVKVVGHMNSANSWNSISEVQFYSPDGTPIMEYVKAKPDVVVEEVVEEIVETVVEINLEGKPILPTDDAFVEIANPDKVFGTDSDRLRVKAKLDSSLVRIAYLRFDLAEVDKINSAIFQISGKVSTNNPPNSEFEFDVYGIEEDNWTEDKINWNNSPNHAKDSTEVTGLNDTAFHLGSFKMSGAGLDKKYVVDVTEFVKTQKGKDGIVTLMIVDSKVQNGNTDPYSKERKREEQRPYLFIK